MHTIEQRRKIWELYKYYDTEEKHYAASYEYKGRRVLIVREAVYDFRNEWLIFEMPSFSTTINHLNYCTIIRDHIDITPLASLMIDAIFHKKIRLKI